MTVANSQNTVSYSGNGSANQVFHIPFPFDAESSIKVELNGVVKTQTTDTVVGQYTLTGVLTNSTNTVYTNEAADFGWIIYGSTLSTTDVIKITRTQTAVVSTDYSDTGTFGTDTKFERDADNIIMSMANTLNRSETDPLVFDAKMRYVSSLANPVRGDDAINTDTVKVMRDFSGTDTVPDGTGLNQFLTTTFSGTDGSPVFYAPVQVPTTSGVNTRYALKSTGSAAWSWQSVNWIPPAPNDGNGYFLKIDQAGTMSWAKIYEIPMSATGADNDILSLDEAHLTYWRTLNEGDWTKTAAQSSKRFLVKKPLGLAYGPRITYGTHTTSALNLAANNGWTSSVSGGFHGTARETFQFNHNMVDDSGSSVAPDRIFLTVETEKIDPDNTGGDMAIPVWVAMLNHDDESPAGITSTQINGRLQYLNVNDNLTEESSLEHYITRKSLEIHEDQDYKIKVHWMAMKD